MSFHVLCTRVIYKIIIIELVTEIIAMNLSFRVDLIVPQFNRNWF